MDIKYLHNILFLLVKVENESTVKSTELKMVVNTGSRKIIRVSIVLPYGCSHLNSYMEL